MGTNMGLRKMAEVSGISQAALQTTARNYLRIETLHPAIDAICNAIAALSVFQEYDISDRRNSIATVNALNFYRFGGLGIFIPIAFQSTAKRVACERVNLRLRVGNLLIRDQLWRALIVACEFRDVSGIGSLSALRPTTNN